MLLFDDVALAEGEGAELDHQEAARARRARRGPGRRRAPGRCTPPAQPRPKIGSRRTSRRRPSRSISSASRLGVAMPVVETHTTASIVARRRARAWSSAVARRARRAARRHARDRARCARPSRAGARTSRSARRNSAARCRHWRRPASAGRARRGAGAAEDARARGSPPPSWPSAIGRHARWRAREGAGGRCSLAAGSRGR